MVLLGLRPRYTRLSKLSERGITGCNEPFQESVEHSAGFFCVFAVERGLEFSFLCGGAYKKAKFVFFICPVCVKYRQSNFI